MKFLFISSMLLSAVGITLQSMLCLDWVWHFLLFFFYTLHNKSRLWRHLILENRIWFETSFLFLERGHSILVSNINHSKIQKNSKLISLTKGSKVCFEFRTPERIKKTKQFQFENYARVNLDTRELWEGSGFLKVNAAFYC
jgi:predicted membrane protein